MAWRYTVAERPFASSYSPRSPESTGHRRPKRFDPFAGQPEQSVFDSP
jgi:hypothetical protein